MLRLIRRSLLLTLFVILGGGTLAHGQIEISQEFYRNQLGESYSTVSYSATDPASVQNIVDAVGADMTYDFTAAAYAKTYEGTTSYIELPADIPGTDKSEFADATHAVQVDFDAAGTDADSTAWSYQQLAGDGIYYAGLMYLDDADDDESKDTLSIVYDDPLRSVALPLEYETAWKDTTSQSIQIGGNSITSEYVLEAEVDGYGELITPAGSAPALRVRQVTHTTNELTNTTSTTTILVFLTKGRLTGTILLDDQGSVISASYSTSSETATDTDHLAGLPERYSLGQNYPNPFNPSTTIQFTLREANTVNLTLFDALGRRVKTLVQGSRSAGTHSVELDANGLATGTYFYRLKAGSFTQTRTLTIVR